MDARERFAALLADFGHTLGENLALDAADDTCSLLVDGDVAVNLTWLPRTAHVLAWASVGGLPEDEYRVARARRLLEMNDGGRGTAGFTLALSPEDRRVVAHDHRSLRALDTADRLAAWVDALVTLVHRVQNAFERDAPYWDDAEDGEDTPDAS